MADSLHPQILGAFAVAEPGRGPRNAAATDALLRLLQGDALPSSPGGPGVEPGRAARCRALIAAGGDPGARDPEGRPLISLAAVCLDGAGCVDALLRAGASPLARDGAGELPLLAALAARREACALILIEATASLGPAARATFDRAGRDGLTPLALAASRGLGGAVLALLAQGAATDPAQDGQPTALMAALDWPFLPEDWLTALIDASDLAARDAAGLTALDLAVERRNWGAWLALRAAGAPGGPAQASLLAKLAEKGVDRSSRLAASLIALVEADLPERDLAAASLIGSLLAEGWQDIGRLAPIAPEFCARLVLTLASGVPAREREAAPFAARLAELARPEGVRLH